MSELEPGFNTAVKDERDVLKQKQDEYERALFDVQQKEAFGKFDVAVPNSGEDTYQSYLDQRPSESIVLNSADKPVGAETNRFASKEAYEAQNSSTQDYYDKLGGVAAKQEQFTPPTYEEMGLLQLAKEASKARQLGDPAEEATIRAALENHLAGDALKDDTETLNKPKLATMLILRVTMTLLTDFQSAVKLGHLTLLRLTLNQMEKDSLLLVPKLLRQKPKRAPKKQILQKLQLKRAIQPMRPKKHQRKLNKQLIQQSQILT